MAARDLPARPNLAQYKKQAKQLLKQWKASDPQTTRKLADAQHEVARNHFFEGWDHFVQFARELQDASSLVARFERAVDMVVSGDAASLKQFVNHQPSQFRRPAEESGPPVNSTQPREQWLQPEDWLPRLAVTQLACAGAQQPDKVATGYERVRDRLAVDGRERGPDPAVDGRHEERPGRQPL